MEVLRNENLSRKLLVVIQNMSRQRSIFSGIKSSEKFSLKKAWNCVRLQIAFSHIWSHCNKWGRMILGSSQKCGYAFVKPWTMYCGKYLWSKISEIIFLSWCSCSTVKKVPNPAHALISNENVHLTSHKKVELDTALTWNVSKHSSIIGLAGRKL